MKKIVILTNKDGRKVVMGKTEIPFRLNCKMNNICVIIRSDVCSLKDLRDDCGETAPDYLALHNSGLSNGVTNIDLNDKYLRDCTCETFSHYDTDGNFYKVILPKAYNGELTLNDIEKAFQTKLDNALDEICSTWATIDFTNKTAMKVLADEASKQLNDLV